MPRIDIRVLVPLGTLLGLTGDPGYLPGFGSIPPELCRQLAAQAAFWKTAVHDPQTGQLVALGERRYRPSPQVREFVELRDQTCRSPGCGRIAERCQYDHGIPFDAGGETCVESNEMLCAHHHQRKTHSNWHFRIDPDTAETIWTTPTGHTYATRPPPLGGVTPPTENRPPPHRQPGYPEEPPY